MRDILFMRKYPTALARGRMQALWKTGHSIFGEGQAEIIAGHRVIFFFSGYGTRIRTIPSAIVRDINNGTISDVIDVGAGGALDPALKVGDLVLSGGEVNIDGSVLPTQRRRDEVAGIVKAIADESRCGFYQQRILTSRRVVAGRAERLRLYEETGAGVVQMEHYWFVDRLKSLVTAEAFAALHMTHVELVADAVPGAQASRFERMNMALRAFDICVLRNDQHLGRLKTRLLFELLASQ